MRVSDWTKETIVDKVNQQFEGNPLPVHRNGETTEYGDFVFVLVEILLNSLYQLPGGFLLRLFMTDEILTGLASIIGAAYTAGILSERAGWFKADWKSHEEFSEKLDIFSES